MPSYTVNKCFRYDKFNEVLRELKECVAVFITTDKVYQNKEWSYSYREVDPLGGYDPYSSSKAAAEIAISSWCPKFLWRPTHQTFI